MSQQGCCYALLRSVFVSNVDFFQVLMQLLVRSTNLHARQANGHVTWLVSSNCSMRPLFPSHKSMRTWLS